MKTKLIDYVDNGPIFITGHVNPCLLYTSDAADE